MSQCDEVRYLAGKKFVCIEEEHPDKPDAHRMVEESRA